MVDLLPNKKSDKEKDYIGSGYESDNNKDENQNNSSDKNKKKTAKVDVERYKDPEGLTVKSLERSLWFASHKKLMWQILYGFLILISVVTWSVFVYSYGYYLLFGIRQDNMHLRALIVENSLNHGAAVKYSARPIDTGPVQVLKVDKGTYDIAARIKNPNPEHWGVFDYEFRIPEGVIHSGQGYILPGRSKFLLALKQEAQGDLSRASLSIHNLNWQRINKHDHPEWKEFQKDHLRIAIDEIDFVPAKSSILTDKLNLSELEFVVENNTPYNYWNVDLIVSLYNRSDKLLGVNQFRLEEFRSGDSRKPELTWPGRLGDVDDILIEPYVNFLDPEVYMRFNSERE